MSYKTATRTPFSLTMPNEVYEALRYQSYVRRLTMAEIIVQALEKELPVVVKDSLEAAS